MTNTIVSDDPTNPEWAQALDGQPATTEQIEASASAEQGLIRIDRTGALATGTDTARIWID